MKRFLTVAVTLILLYFLIDTAYYRWGLYINLDKKEQNITFHTTVQGEEILLDTGAGPEPFEIRGIDMGIGIPGHFATDNAIDKETYLRWFRLIQDMGANTVRVYTILSGDFYNALYEYNYNNPKPLYILHGVWVNDYVQNSHMDAYEKPFIDTFTRDCRALVDVLHGKKKLSLGYGTTSASGSYTKDVSPWVLGYILGVEWEEATVAYTDHQRKELNRYSGRYLYTTEDATPFEAMLARVGDSMISYESDKYGTQRLMAFSNWPTTDPFDYPQAVNTFLGKYAKVDVEHIKTTAYFLSGQFASYHIYPYYPDYLRYFDEWKATLPDSASYRLPNGTYNTYRAYLEMINRHHTMPVIISEFGIPASRGRAQSGNNTGRAQGYMSEKEQGEAIRLCYEDIMASGSAGSVIFTWQDEWFKRTWNTMANVDLSQTAYWSDYQTNEQYFGILAFDPGTEKSISYTDGDVSEWRGEEPVASNEDYKLYAKYDEKFVYLRVSGEAENFGLEKLYIPIDVTPKSGSNYMQGEHIKFERPSDFVIILDGEENSSIVVQERYDVFKAVYSEQYEGYSAFLEPPDKMSPVFNKIYLALQSRSINKLNPENVGVRERFETGRLTCGNGNPASPDYNSLSDFIVKGGELEIRIPWQLLNFSCPSKMEVHDDYYEHYGIRNLGIKEIYLGIGSELSKEERIKMGSIRLKGWGRKPTYHERLKQSYYIVQEMWGE